MGTASAACSPIDAAGYVAAMRMRRCRGECTTPPRRGPPHAARHGTPHGTTHKELDAFFRCCVRNSETRRSRPESQVRWQRVMVASMIEKRLTVTQSIVLVR